MSNWLLKTLLCALCLLCIDSVNCNATTPPELVGIINRWKRSCIGKEFETTGIGVQAIEDLKKDPFVGKDETKHFQSRMTFGFYDNAAYVKVRSAGPTESIDLQPQGYSVWFDGRSTGYQDAKADEKIVVLDGPDPIGDRFGAESALLLVGWGLPRNKTIQDLLELYEVWESVKINQTTKVFRGRSVNGTIEVGVTTSSSSEEVISYLLGNLQFKHAINGDPVKSNFHVLFEYRTPAPDDVIPSVVESRAIDTVKGVRYSHANRYTLSSPIRQAKPLERRADGLPTIPNGTRVQVDDYLEVEFEWRDGEIVRKIDREKVKSLLGFKFSGVKWLLPALLLLAGGAIGFVWYRRSRS
jgi:hypothetical protein